MTSNSQLSAYYIHRKIIKFLLLATGVFPLEDASLFYRLLPYMHLSLHFCTAIGTFGFVRAHITDVMLASKRMSLLLSFMWASLKLICLTTYREDTKELFKVLDEYFNNLINNPKLTDLIVRDMNKFRRMAWAIMLLVTFAMVNVIAPVSSLIYQYTHHVEPIKYSLPYLSIYPWTVKPNGWLWKMHFTLESFATFSLVIITSSVEPLFSLYVLQMIGQLREMSHRIIHLDDFKDNDTALRSCVLQYQMLIKCRNSIEKIFGPIILWMIIGNALSLCLAMLQLFQMKGITPGAALFFGTYVLTKVVQTFLCAWSGTRLVVESEQYMMAVYSSNWNANKRIMTSVVIMLTQRPLNLTACHFSTISNDIFVSVLNTTISYYFLLKTLQHTQ